MGSRTRRSQRAGPAEARWFGRGQVPIVPDGAGRERTDAYHLDSLRPTYAVKRRGVTEVLEAKERVGRVDLVDVVGAPGFAERWVKHRVPPAAARPLRRSRWIEVTKMAWSIGPVELVAVCVAGETWWSIAVCPALPQPDVAALVPYADLLRMAEPASFPAWLLDRVGRRDDRQVAAC